MLLKASQHLQTPEEYTATPRTAREVETYWQLIGALAQMGEPQAWAIVEARERLDIESQFSGAHQT